MLYGDGQREASISFRVVNIDCHILLCTCSLGVYGFFQLLFVGNLVVVCLSRENHIRYVGVQCDAI